MINLSDDPDLLAYLHAMRELSDNTRRVRTDLLRRLRTFAGVPLREVQPGHLLRFERLAIAGRSLQTRHAYVGHLRSFFRWAHETGLTAEDPSAVLTSPPLSLRPARPIDPDDFAAALTGARPKLRAVLVLAASAGLDCQQVAGLDWSDLRLEADGAAVLRVRTGRRERQMHLGSAAARAVQMYGMRAGGPMFRGLGGLPMDPKSVSHAVNRHLARYGIDATMRDLRRSQVAREVVEQVGTATSDDLALLAWSGAWR